MSGTTIKTQDTPYLSALLKKKKTIRAVADLIGYSDGGLLAAINDPKGIRKTIELAAKAIYIDTYGELNILKSCPFCGGEATLDESHT